MHSHSIQFLQEHVEGIVGGTVAWTRAVSVPTSWWREYQRPSQVPSIVCASVVHVFQISRTFEDIKEASLKSMGRSGAAYVWTYCRDRSSFYTAVFAANDTPDGPEQAVRARANELRPWKLRKKSQRSGRVNPCLCWTFGHTNNQRS